VDAGPPCGAAPADAPTADTVHGLTAKRLSAPRPESGLSLGPGLVLSAGSVVFAAGVTVGMDVAVVIRLPRRRAVLRVRWRGTAAQHLAGVRHASEHRHRPEHGDRQEASQKDPRPTPAPARY